MKLRFRVASSTLSEGLRGERFASVRLVPIVCVDNQVLWEGRPTGSIELNGILARMTDALRVGFDLEVTVEEPT